MEKRGGKYDQKMGKLRSLVENDSRERKVQYRAAEVVNRSPRIQTKIIQSEQKKRFGNAKMTQSILEKAP